MNDMNVENTEAEGITVIIDYAQVPKQPILLVHTSLKLLFFIHWSAYYYNYPAI